MSPTRKVWSNYKSVGKQEYKESKIYIYGKNKKLPECFKEHDKQPMKRENDKGL